MEMSKARTLQVLVDVMSRHGAASAATLEQAIGRAEARAGLGRASTIDERQLNTLLWALAAEGGRIQQVAETIAVWRAEAESAASEGGADAGGRG